MSSAPRGVSERHLASLVEEVGRAPSIEEACRCALDFFERALGVERASVVALDDSGQPRVLAWRGLSEEYRATLEQGLPWEADTVEPAAIVVPEVGVGKTLAAWSPLFKGEGVAAVAFVPLRFAGRFLGGLALHHADPHVFGDSEIAIARIVAGHVAVALDRARLHRRLDGYKTLLVRAGEALSRPRELEEIFEVLAELAIPALADAVAIHRVDGRGRATLAHVAHADADKRELARLAFDHFAAPADADVGPTASIESGRSSLVTRDLLGRLVASPEHLAAIEALGLRSAIIVPLSRSRRPIAAMTLVTSESGRVFGAADLEVAEALASRATLAIDNARLSRAAEEARRSAEDLALRFDVLSRASASIAAALDPDVALQQLARLIATTVADCCVAYRLGDDGSIRHAGLAHADVEAEPRLEEAVRRGLPQPDDDDGVGAVLRTGKPILTRDVSSTPCQAGARSLETLRVLEPLSSIVVPLEARGRTLGALAMVTTARSGRRYRHSELALALEIAGRAALLVDNARLYDEARRASKARDELLAVVSHDLRSPLNTIVTASELLGMDLPEERHARTRASVARAAEHMTRLLDDLLDLTRIDRGQLSVSLAPLDVTGLVSEIVSMHQPVAEGRSIRLIEGIPEGPIEIDGDRGRLGQALSNLLANALEFTPSGGEVSVTVATNHTLVSIAVADTGPGISGEELPHLFDRFWRADRKSSRGLGLGLTIVKGIAEAHGGEVAVRSRPGEGSRFVMVLPASPR